MALADRGPHWRSAAEPVIALPESVDDVGPAGGQEPDPRRRAPGERRASAIIGSLCLWDMLAVAAALGLSGAFGPGSGVLALLPTALLSAVALSVAGAYRPAWWLREHPIEMFGGLSLIATATAWGAVLMSALVASRTHTAALVVTWLVLPLAWYLGRRSAAAAWRTRRRTGSSSWAAARLPLRC